MLPVVKNQIVELAVTALNSEGQGVGRVDGYALFLPGALPGERVEALVIKAGRRFGVGKLLRVITPDAGRVEPLCPVSAACGGCALQHASYDLQLRAKREQVQSALARIGGFDVETLPVLGMEHPFYYRNKASFPYAGGGAFGFYAQSSHRVTPVTHCLLQAPAINEAMERISDWAGQCSIAAYDEQTGAGCLRHAVLRTSKRGETLVALVAAKPPPRLERLVEMLREKANGLLLNINRARTNVIWGSKTQTIWGEDRLIEDILGLSFEVSLPSFLQVNPGQTEKLYETALSLADIKPGEWVADVYCGIGTLTLHAAKRAARVIGIECVPEAVRDARANARRNGVENAEFMCGTAERELPGLTGNGARFGAVLLDPPRKGCEPALIDAVIRAAPGRVVYISCNPATLARDAGLLAAGGYAMVCAQPVDMFPHTAHVETVALLRRCGAPV